MIQSTPQFITQMKLRELYRRRAVLLREAYLVDRPLHDSLTPLLRLGGIHCDRCPDPGRIRRGHRV